MALSALLFTKNPETAHEVSAVLAECGMRAEICADIFSAIEKGTKQVFPCIIVDWPDQPEASFLLKRARESGINRSTVAIAIVDDEPPPDQQRDHRLDFLIYRPIVLDEARAVLGKASQKMQIQTAVFAEDMRPATPQQESAASSDQEDANLVAIAADLPKKRPKGDYSASEELADSEGDSEQEIIGPAPKRHVNFRAIAAVVVLIALAFTGWRSRGAFQYLARTPEGVGHVLKESLASLFYVNRSGGASAGAASTDAQQDAYFSRTPPADPKVQTTTIGVLSAEVTIPENIATLPKPADYPFLEPAPPVKEQAPVRVERHVPDSLKNSAPITQPVVVTVNPAQMMPVSAPVIHMPQQTGEPVVVTEEAARALVITTVDPAYPPEAKAQKLQGSVVLQALIGRDGTVEDLKMVRGYFVLSRAAVAAVKQWRFRPYVVNGRPLQTQTTITINFTYPTS